MVNEKVSLFVRLSTFSRWGVEIAWQLCICTQCYCAVISKCVWFTGAMCSNLSPFIWERVGYLINAVFSIDVCMRNNKKSIMHVLTKTRYSMMYCWKIVVSGTEKREQCINSNTYICFLSICKNRPFIVEKHIVCFSVRSGVF